VFQVAALVTALVTLCLATPPPGYVKKPDNDKVSWDQYLWHSVVPCLLSNTKTGLLGLLQFSAILWYCAGYKSSLLLLLY